MDYEKIEKFYLLENALKLANSSIRELLLEVEKETIEEKRMEIYDKV